MNTPVENMVLEKPVQMRFLNTQSPLESVFYNPRKQIPPESVPVDLLQSRKLNRFLFTTGMLVSGRLLMQGSVQESLLNPYCMIGGALIAQVSDVLHMLPPSILDPLRKASKRANIKLNKVAGMLIGSVVFELANTGSIYGTEGWAMRWVMGAGLAWAGMSLGDYASGTHFLQELFL